MGLRVTTDKFIEKSTNNHNKKLFGDLYTKTFNSFDKVKSFGYNVKYIWENDWETWKKQKIGPIPIKTY